MIFDRILLALQFWWKSLLPLVWISLPFVVVAAATQWLFGPALTIEKETITGTSGVTIVTLLILEVLRKGAVICQLDSLAQGRTRSLLDCLLFTLYLFPQLAIVSLLMVMPLAAAILLAMAVAGGPAAALTLMFMLIGMWMFMRLSLAVFYTAMERQKPIQALLSSFQKTEPQQWPLLGAWMLILMIILVLYGALGGALEAILGDYQAVSMIADLGLEMLGLIVTTLLYQAYRGITPPTQD